MPGDVAMHEPDARIVCAERNDEVAASREQGDVATRRVVPIQGRVDDLVVVCSLGENTT